MMKILEVYDADISNKTCYDENITSLYKLFLASYFKRGQYMSGIKYYYIYKQWI